ASSRRGAGIWAAAGVAALLCLLTWPRQACFANEEALWRDNLRKNPQAWIANFRLGVLLSEEGKTDEAVPHFISAAQTEPDYAPAHYNLAMAYKRQGRAAEAASEYLAALRYNPDYAEAHNNLGNLLADQGKNREAM